MIDFHESYMPEPMSGCWIWTGKLTFHGYGYAGHHKRNRQPLTAHRKSWQIHRGPIPEGKHVLHKCDVRCCVNPDHLYVGTQADNNMDRQVRHPNAKIQPSDLPDIRTMLAKGMRHQKIADKYGVTRETICHINRGATWRQT